VKHEKLYMKARIKGDDGFVMAKHILVCNEENVKNLIKMLGVEVDTSEWHPRQFEYVDVRLMDKLFIGHLKDFCADTFGVASYPMRPTEEDDYVHKICFFLAFRSRKDLFKFCMKFASKRTRWWSSSIGFTILATDDDPYEKTPAGEKWNKEDPHGFIRP